MLTAVALSSRFQSRLSRRRLLPALDASSPSRLSWRDCFVLLGRPKIPSFEPLVSGDSRRPSNIHRFHPWEKTASVSCDQAQNLQDEKTQGRIACGRSRSLASSSAPGWLALAASVVVGFGCLAEKHVYKGVKHVTREQKQPFTVYVLSFSTVHSIYIYIWM